MMTQNKFSKNKKKATLFAEVEHAGSITRFDIVKYSTDLHTFIIICERPDNRGQKANTAIRSCMDHLRRHGVWHQSKRDRVSFLYFDPTAGYLARLTPEISDSGTIQTVDWNSVPDYFTTRLELSEYYVEANEESSLGIFSQMF